jgi:co-chaperonin GroES (HSP10)
MKPIGKYIVINSVVEEDVRTQSGLLLSGEDAKGFRYQRAVVVKPGTDVTVIKEGDTIYYDKGHGFTMLIEDKPYTVIMERDVVVVV